MATCPAVSEACDRFNMPLSMLCTCNMPQQFMPNQECLSLVLLQAYAQLSVSPWCCCLQGCGAFRWAGFSSTFACCSCRWRWIALCRTSWSLSHTILFPHSLRWLNCTSMYCGQGTSQHSVYLCGICSAKSVSACLLTQEQEWETKRAGELIVRHWAGKLDCALTVHGSPKQTELRLAVA